MIIGIVVIVLGAGAVLLSLLQIRGILPVVRRTYVSVISGYINLLIGICLIALGLLRVTGHL